MPELTSYEQFEQSSPKNRRLLREEEILLKTSNDIYTLMEEKKMTSSKLARRLGWTTARVKEILGGDITLRELASIADALDYKVVVDWFSK